MALSHAAGGNADVRTSGVLTILIHIKSVYVHKEICMGNVHSSIVLKVNSWT